MLVNLNTVLEYANKHQCAIGAFNGNSMAATRAIISAAEQKNVPVILMHAQVHESLIPLSDAGPMLLNAAKNAKVPVCVHLDHGEDINYIMRAAEMGFTSVMYDGSLLPYEQNLENTKGVVKALKPRNISIEAELGAMGSREGDGEGEHNSGISHGAVYTDPAQAQAFVSETGIDALACSFGTVHGLYIKKPKLDFSVLKNINKLTNIPLVMHGGSGVSEGDYHMAIACGVRKINYYTYMAKAGGEAVIREIEKISDKSNVLYHQIEQWAMLGMEENVTEALRVFGG